MRIWQVKEQTVEDPTTKLRFEFSSVHTDEVNAGNEAPTSDAVVIMRLWTSDRTRMVEMRFERNGAFMYATIVPLDGVDGIGVAEVGEPV